MAGKLKQIFGSVFRSLHQLWLEVTGTFLVIMGVALGFHVFQSFRKLGTTTDESGSWHIWASGMLSVATLAFGIHSFWKSRNLR